MCPAPPAPPSSPDAHYVRLEAPPTPASEQSAPEATGTGAAATAAVLANAVMGAGILALPYAYARSGVAGGPALVLFAGVLNAFTMHLLSSVGRRVAQDNASFHAVASKTLPPKLWWLADFTVCSMMALVATSYLIVFANLAQAALASKKRYPYVVIAAGVCAPWAYAEKLGGVLRHTSALGLILAIYVALLSIANWLDAEKFQPCEHGHHCGGTYQLFELNLKTLDAFALATFAFTAQTQVPQCANGLQDYSQSKMDLVCIGAVLFCSVLYAVIGHAGYETFGSLVNSDLLESYPNTSYVEAARLAVAVVVATSYPLVVVPFRDSLHSILKHQSLSSSVKAFAASRHFRVVVTSTFILASALTCLVVEDLGIVLSIVGSTAGTMVAYAIPSYAYVKTFKGDPERKCQLVLARCVFAYSVVAVPACLYATFRP
jgi:amino acid permease